MSDTPLQAAVRRIIECYWHPAGIGPIQRFDEQTTSLAWADLRMSLGVEQKPPAPRFMIGDRVQGHSISQHRFVGTVISSCHSDPFGWEHYLKLDNGEFMKYVPDSELKPEGAVPVDAPDPAYWEPGAPNTLCPKLKENDRVRVKTTGELATFNKVVEVLLTPQGINEVPCDVTLDTGPYMGTTVREPICNLEKVP